MIVGGCLGLGLWYRDQMIGRIRALRTLASILEMWMSEIRYGKATLPESCGQLAGRLGEPYAGCLKAVCEELGGAGSASFQEVFCRRMDNCLKELPLKEEDREMFLQPFRGQGFQDGAMQLKNLEQGLGRIRELTGQQEQEQKERCRMAVGLGAMSGLLLLIILL